MKFYDPYAIGLEVSKITGDEAICKCPFHDDKKPSSSFNIKQGVFYCFGCGESMGAHDLALALDGEIVLNESISEPLDEAKSVEEFKLYLGTTASAIGAEYLKERRVSDDLVKCFDLRIHKDGIIIPIKTMDGLPVGVQIRRFKLKPKYMLYGQKQPLWPMEILPEVKRGERVFIVEGIFGALRLMQAGFHAFATMGSQKVKHAAQVLNGRNGIVVFDPDFAGYLGAAKFAKLGFDVALPTIVADSTSLPKIREFSSALVLTRSMTQIAEVSGDAEKLLRIVSKFS